MSVIDYVDKMIIFDNGSTDKTVPIIQTILQNKVYKEKVIFMKRPEVTPVDFWKLRQEQINMTDTDYMMVLDGDEIWWADSMKEIKNIIEEERPELIVTHHIKAGGDIYHYRDNSREKYRINGITGSISTRVFSMHIDGLHCDGYYGIEGYKDGAGKDLHNHGRKTIFMKGSYLHTSVLRRSSDRKGDLNVTFRKSKLLFQNTYDWKFPPDFLWPEVLYLNRPSLVKSPWKKNRSILHLVAQSLHMIRYLIDHNMRKQLSGKEF